MLTKMNSLLSKCISTSLTLTFALRRRSMAERQEMRLVKTFTCLYHECKITTSSQKNPVMVKRLSEME